MQDAVRKLREVVNLKQLARDAYEKGKNYDRSRKILALKLRQTPDLFVDICDVAAGTLIQDVAREIRRGLGAHTGIQAAEHHPEGLAAMARTRAVDLLDTPLGWSDGLRLGEARKEDVQREESGYRKMARGNMVKAKWMKLIAGRVHGECKVKETLDDKKLRSLFDRANDET